MIGPKFLDEIQDITGDSEFRFALLFVLVDIANSLDHIQRYGIQVDTRR